MCIFVSFTTLMPLALGEGKFQTTTDCSIVLLPPAIQACRP
uniref:Uncharacterized protein n=1 Tax=Setaria viridis TaxID=4556 RepID=A0A4U6V9G1_SETVI|nr:hypothetical protein SEVIR_3G046850v2 [Setaria viridis]